jgi:L-alanine-DL-glutamate epimerase-like enolase superfamily enzyme
VKITRIEITHHQLELDPPFPASWDPQPRKKFPATVVRVHDDEGRMGVGSGDSMAGFEDYADLFVGRDPLDLDRYAAVLDNIAFHAGRPWPLDVALWDLAGRIRGQPVWRMLGGATDRVRPYASCGVLRSAQDSVRQAERALDLGFAALKLRFGRPETSDDLAVLEAVRSAVGDRLELMVDCNQGWRMPWDTARPWSYEKALEVARELEALDVYWMEEPLHRGDYDGMQRLNAETPLRIAGGEMTRERYEFQVLLERECLDVFQPDVVCSLGMSGLRDLALEVRRRGRIFSPHTWGNGIGLLANLHLTAGSVGAPFLELPWDPPEWTAERRDFVLAQPVMPDAEGWLRLSDAPGLGIELDEERLMATESQRTTYR